jgi:hypothetical protein
MTVIKQEAAGTQPGVLGAAARTRGQVSTVVIAPDELEAAVYELAVTPGAAPGGTRFPAVWPRSGPLDSGCDRPYRQVVACATR